MLRVVDLRVSGIAGPAWDDRCRDRIRRSIFESARMIAAVAVESVAVIALFVDFRDAVAAVRENAVA